MTTRIHESVRDDKGFTLVELAVVMVIIGLLIGGVLKGQEMIANAQVTSTVAQMKAIDAATGTFRDMYDAFPGDMTNPATRLPASCVVACAVAGSGDGRLSSVPLAAAGTEATAFFPQLEAAELVSGINVNNFMDTTVRGNEFVPGYSAGGALGDLTAARGGHYLAIVLSNTANGVGLLPLEASRMDRKIDDGNPTTGSAGGNGGAPCGTNALGYIESTQAQVCGFVVRVQG